jgi:hypothetical protein
MAFLTTAFETPDHIVVLVLFAKGITLTCEQILFVIRGLHFQNDVPFVSIRRSENWEQSALLANLEFESQGKSDRKDFWTIPMSRRLKKLFECLKLQSERFLRHAQKHCERWQSRNLFRA